MIGLLKSKIKNEMVIEKSRNVYYDNLKFFLIFLVVLGHVIENTALETGKWLSLYRVIYMVHIPVFAFVSGVFLKNKEACIKQAKKMLKFYIFAQPISMLLQFVLYRRCNSFLKPYWHLWYLVSLLLWSLLIYFIEYVRKGKNKKLVYGIVLIVSLVLSLVCGGVSIPNKYLEISRTLAFLPYVILGVIVPENFSFKKLLKFDVINIILIIFLIINFSKYIPTKFLYHSSSFGDIGFLTGFGLKALCFALAVLMGMVIVSCVPKKEFFFSRVGTETMWIYLLHAYAVLALEKVGILSDVPLLLALLITIAIIALIYCGLRMVYKCNITYDKK